MASELLPEFMDIAPKCIEILYSYRTREVRLNNVTYLTFD